MSFARLWLAAGLLASVGAASAQEDPLGVFAEANELFRQGNQAQASDPTNADESYRRAALRYQHLIEERGIRNSKLYYNLANAHHQLGDIGFAIVNYRRAERLDPGDANVRRNLEQARSRRQDKFNPAAGNQTLRTLLFWHFEFASSTRVRLFACAWVLLWWLLLLRASGVGWVPREIAVGAAAVAALLIGSVIYEAVATANHPEGVIVATDTIARLGDGQSYDSAFREPLHAGAEFRVLEQRPDWYHVELPDGSQCWVSAEDVELLL